ncbi:MAG: C25 family cysteine peptidase, partial [Bacteroidota bacterium]
SPMIADIRVSGLSPAIYSLYRYDSNDNTFQKITNFQFLSDTLHFADSVKNGISYCLLREDKIPAPVFFYKRKFINLRDAARQADYIAITHPYFLSAAQSYASFIASSYGITATVVNINDIYDEFNDGFFSPEPIRTFLKTAYEKWQDPKPKYAFLIGKATYDFYGNKSKYFGAPKIMNFVPSYGNPVSDNWFVMWDLPVSFVPQMNIGRLPVQTIDEFQSYFVKHQKYLSKGFDDWNKRYLFFAGGNFTDPSQIADAKGVNDYIINNYINSHPIGGNFANFYKTTNPVTNFGPYSPDYIQDAIDRGGVFISYIGHSGTQTWDNSITDMSQLKNTHDRSPLITDFGCSTGKFAEPDVVSFSELAVSEANGQAIGYIGNSSLGFTSTALGNGNPLNSFPKYFYKKLLIDTSASIGDVHRLARIDYLKQFGSSGAYGLFAKTNSLIGDPIVRLPIPTKPNYSIANSVMEISPENPTDQTESIGIALHYFNYGTVAGDSVTITIQDDYQGVTVFASTLRKKIPFYTDSVGISLPVKNKPGEHTITVSLDPENEIDEIYENDNVVVKKLLVAATTLRNLTGYQTLNQTDGKIVYLNPSAPSSNPQFLIDVSEQESFAQKQTFQVPFDTFYTQFTFENTYSGKRVWMRTRLNDISGEGITNSYVIGNKINYSIRDSASFQKVGKSVLAYRNDRLVLDSSRITFSVISAGQNDGNTAVITKNGQNYIPENTLRGYHVALFNKTSFEFVKYYWFEVIASSTIAASFAAFLDTLPPNYLVAISVSDEGSTNLTAQLKSSIKNYGSKFIDSVKFRYSWGMIGWKGALPGSVPEKFTKTFEGRVQIDTTITLPDTIGTFETPQFSSVAKWKDLKIGYTSVKPGDISLSVIGIKKNSESDTVKSVAVNDSIVTLTDIDANVYPSVKLAGTMHRSPGDQSPSVSSLEINYDPLPEIGTNYQAVQAYLSENGIRGKQIQPGDTVQQGEKVELVMKVYNASRIDVKHVKVLANAVWDNNSTESIISTTIDSIGALSKKELSALYNTSLGFGKRNFYITVDPDSALAEAYKDNNVYSFPFVVAKSSSHTLLPNLTITQNDIRLLTNPVTEQTDSAKVVLRYENTGALIGDSITISVRHFFQGVNIDTWTIRRKYPVSADTISLSLPINKQAGEHQLQVELDPVGLVLESSESDNLVNFYFKVVTTDFTVMQPTAFSTSAFSRIIWLNPTDIQSPEKSSAEIQLDTTESIASAVVTVPMNEFTTTYDIGSLKKLRRYYWRIRVQNSGREWTTGSFFLGDSSSFSLGQVDSASWALNTFVHSAYLPNSGAQIVDTRFAIHAASAGFSDGKSGAVTLNGTNLLAPIYGAGHNIVVIDTSNYSVVTARRFDVSNDPAETDSLIQFIASVLSGRMVVDVIVDDGANNLNAAARNALKTIGSSEIDNVGFRDSWGIIGRKGAASGTVPEQYKQQSSGSVAIDTLIIRKEYAGSIETAEFGPVTDISQFSIAGSVPAGTTLKATLFGRSGTTTDSIPLSGYITPLAKRAAAVYYPSAAIRFDLSTTNQSTPVVQRWSLAASPVKELALSEQTSTIDHPSVIEGEPITLSSTIYNVGGFAADSVTVQIKANDGIIDRVLQTEMLAVLSANDSAKISYVYDTRNRRGDHVFTVQIDPLHTFNEQTTANNAMTIPFTVIGDTLRPDIHVTVDGIQIVNGDYVSSHPEIFIQYKDNNPSGLLPSDT